MGSKNDDPRQLDGIGGATSTTSKVAVVSPSSRPGIDVEYTFAQVAVGKESVDYTGNCGNIASGVGPYAVEEGMVEVPFGATEVDVRIFNTNTSSTLVETVQVDEDGMFYEIGSYQMPGVKGTGSEIKVAFVSPAGSMTGKLLPTGNKEDTIMVDTTHSSGNAGFAVQASLVDAANPFVFVDASTMPLWAANYTPNDPEFQEVLESIRRKGSVMMGLAQTVEEASLTRGTPKIALLSPPPPAPVNSKERQADIFVAAQSMGKPHPSLQLTGAVCLGSALSIHGTVAQKIAMQSLAWSLGLGTKVASLSSSPSTPPSRSDSVSPILSLSRASSLSSISEGEVSGARSFHSTAEAPDVTRRVRIAHSSGVVQVEVQASVSSKETVINGCCVSRTARKLFEGSVMFYN